MAGQSDAQPFMALARAAECCVSNFHSQAMVMTLWALSQRESLRDSWSLFDHVCIGVSFSLRCFGAHLMEYEHQELLEYEIALLQGLEGTAGNHGAEVDFRAATKRGAAMRLAETNEMKLPDDSQLVAGVNRKTSSATQ